MNLKIFQRRIQRALMKKYKKNLDTIFSLIGPIMEKEIYINNLTDFALDFMKDNSENEINMRNSLPFSISYIIF